MTDKANMSFKQKIHFAKRFIERQSSIASSCLKRRALDKAEDYANSAIGQARTNRDFKELEKILDTIETIRGI